MTNFKPSKKYNKLYRQLKGRYNKSLAMRIVNLNERLDTMPPEFKIENKHGKIYNPFKEVVLKESGKDEDTRINLDQP